MELTEDTKAQLANLLQDGQDGITHIQVGSGTGQHTSAHWIHTGIGTLITHSTGILYVENLVTCLYTIHCMVNIWLWYNIFFSYNWFYSVFPKKRLSRVYFITNCLQALSMLFIFRQYALSNIPIHSLVSSSSDSLFIQLSIYLCTFYMFLFILFNCYNYF